MSDAEWDMLTTGLNRLGELANSRGFRLTFHHHAGTVVMTEAEIDRLMQGTDADKVWLLLDTGHLLIGGDDPIRVLQKYASRVGNVHLKDCHTEIAKQVDKERLSFARALRLGVFAVPGAGDFDYESAFALLDTAGYEGWLMVEAEQDPERYDRWNLRLPQEPTSKVILGFLNRFRLAMHAGWLNKKQNRRKELVL